MAETRAASDAAAPHPDIIREAERILAASQERGVVLRLFGGVAIALRCPGRRTPRSAATTRISTSPAALGSVRRSPPSSRSSVTSPTAPSTPFTAISASSSGASATDARFDVVFDRLRMSHTFDLRDRLAVDDRTLPLADLLLFKLQVIEANEKDVTDAIALLGAHPLGEDDRAINVVHIARLAADDWGLGHTLEWSLARVRRSPTCGAARPRARFRLRRRWRPCSNASPPNRRAPAGNCGRAWASVSAGTNCRRKCARMRLGMLRRNTTKPFVLFFATDLHGSEKCFMKFLNAAKFYEADGLILGGDLTGKGLIPLVPPTAAATAPSSRVGR